MFALMSRTKIAFAASVVPEAREAMELLRARYPSVPAEDADVIVALGGDGFMLEMLHTHMDRRIPIYGMNKGTVGFLMNDYSDDGLLERIRGAVSASIHPLAMRAKCTDSRIIEAVAINEVALLR